MANYVISIIIRYIYKDETLVITGLNNLIRLLISIVVALAVYGVLLIKLGAVTENEIKQMPGGTRIAGVVSGRIKPLNMEKNSKRFAVGKGSKPLRRRRKSVRKRKI